MPVDTGISIKLGSSDRHHLEAIASDRNTPQKHVWRAEIVLLSADGGGTVEIMHRTGTSKTCVWRWQERFVAEGVEGLLRDRTRPSRVPPLGQDLIDQVVALTVTEPPHEATHWTATAMAKAVLRIVGPPFRPTIYKKTAGRGGVGIPQCSGRPVGWHMSSRSGITCAGTRRPAA